jgi:hypothetical protein
MRGAVGRLGRSRGGVGEEWRREDEWSSASGELAARRQRGRGEKRREKVGGPGVGGGGATTKTERGETSDGWAAAQYRAVVLLTGGAGLSVGVRLRGRAWAGPRRNGDGPPGCTIRFCIYLN